MNVTKQFLADLAKADTCNGRLVLSYPTEAGGTFTASIWGTEEAKKAILKRRTNTPKPSGFRPIDYGDAAIDLYGDAATAICKLEYQLSVAEELSLDKEAAKRLSALIEELEIRARATANPLSQKTPHIHMLIDQMKLREEEELKQECLKTAENHPSFHRLRDDIAELSKKFGKYCGGSPLAYPSPLTFRLATKQSKLAKKIIATQQEIGKDLHLRWDKRGFADIGSYRRPVEEPLAVSMEDSMF